MKKITAILLALTMILSISAFAAPMEDLNEIMENTNKITSASMKMNIGAKLNKPISNDLTGGLDITSILDAFKYTIDMDFDVVNENQMQAIMKILMAVPLEKEISIESYLDMDLNNLDSPKFKVIMQSPESSKYMVIDYAKIPGFMDIFKDSVKNQESSELIKKLLLDVNLDDLKVTEENGTYKVIISKEITSQLMKNYVEVVFSMTENMIPMEQIEEMGKAIEKIFDLEIFNEEAVVLEFKANQNKVIDYMKFNVNINANIFDIATSMDGKLPENITKENSQIDATIFMEYTFDYDKKIEITIPELTEENSIDVLDEALNQTGIIVIVDDKKVEFDVEPIMENDRTLVPIRALTNAIGVTDIEYNEETQVITIKDAETTIVLTVDDKNAIVNGKEITLDTAAKVIDGRTLVPLRFISETFDLDVGFNSFNNASVINITRKV